MLTGGILRFSDDRSFGFCAALATKTGWNNGQLGLCISLAGCAAYGDRHLGHGNRGEQLWWRHFAHDAIAVLPSENEVAVAFCFWEKLGRSPVTVAGVAGNSLRKFWRGK